MKNCEVLMQKKEITTDKHGSTQMKKLPEGWEWKKLGEVCEPTNNINWNDYEGEKKYIDLSSVSRDLLEVTGYQTINSKNAPSRAKKRIFTNDLIFATTRPTLKRVTIIKSEYDDEVCSTGFVVLRAKSSKVTPEWIFHILLTDSFMEYVEVMQKGASYPAITDNEVKAFQIPLPPLTEQKRIVAILDEAFTAIDKAKANAEKNLANAKELFESYLNGIFANPGEDWEEKKLGDVCEIGDGNYSSKYPKASEFVPVGVPFLTATNLKNGTIISDGIRYISREQHQTLTKGHILEGDLVIVVRGSSTGNNSIVPKDFAGSNLNSQLAFLRVNDNTLSSEFLFAVFNSSQVMKTVKKAISGAAQPQLPNNKLLDLKISFPNIEEQQTIVQNLELLNSETKRLETIYQQKIASLNDVKKSILKKAYEGEL